jgi:hypothetical protein
VYCGEGGVGRIYEPAAVLRTACAAAFSITQRTQRYRIFVHSLRVTFIDGPLRPASAGLPRAED